MARRGRESGDVQGPEDVGREELGELAFGGGPGLGVDQRLVDGADVGLVPDAVGDVRAPGWDQGGERRAAGSRGKEPGGGGPERRTERRADGAVVGEAVHNEEEEEEEARYLGKEINM